MTYRRKNGSWTAIVYVDGRRTTRVCPNKRLAEELERQSKSDRWLVETGLATPTEVVVLRKGHTLATDALENHVEDLRREGKTHAHCDDRKRAVSRVLSGSGITLCNTITDEAARSYIEYITRGKSARTRNHYLLHFKAFCEWLFRNRYVKENPLAHARMIPDKGDANPTRVLSIGEVKRLLNLDTPRMTLYTFVLYTGFRWGARHDGGETGRLLAEWIDFKAAELVIPTEGVTKNRKRVRIPLASIVVDALASERRIGGKLFPTVPTLRTWKSDLALAGIPLRSPEGTVHRKSTRKTFSTRLAEAGVERELRGRLLRHSDTMLVERRYTEKTGAMIRQERQALEKMVRYVQREAQSA